MYGTSHVGEQLHAEAEIYLAILPERQPGERLFEPAAFLRLLRMLGLYDVGRDADGKPLEIPAAFLAAEQAASETSGT